MLSCILFTGKATKTISVNNVHEFILQKQEKKDEAKVLPIKKKISIQKEVIKMGHDKRPNVDTYSVSHIGHVNPSPGPGPSATCTRWRQPLSQECVLFGHMLFIFQTQNKTRFQNISITKIYYRSTLKGCNGFSSL